MSKGEIVLYKGKEYEIKWIYESGYCEIREIEDNKVELVHISEIKGQKVDSC